MTFVPRSPKYRPIGVDKLDPGNAFIALLIAAIDVSGNVSAEEAARADPVHQMRQHVANQDG